MLAQVGFQLAGTHNPLILVPVRVNDRGPWRFILDIGGGMSLLSPRLAGELGLLPPRPSQCAGAGGRVPQGLVHLTSLAIGGARRSPMPIAITAEVERIGEVLGERVDGDVGYDFLQGYHVTIDYRRQRVRLRSARDPARATRSAPAGIPFRLASRVQPLVLIPAFVGGRGPYTFAVDTGAALTCLSPALASALRVAPVEGGSLPGAGGASGALAGRLDSLAVGGVGVEDLAVVVADPPGTVGETVRARLDGVLGYNFLRWFRVTLDYPNGRFGLVRVG